MKMTQIGLVLQISIGLLSLYMAYHGYWIGLLLIVPSLFGDVILRWTNKATVPVVFKMIILFQGITLWICLSSFKGANFLPLGNERLFPGHVPVKNSVDFKENNLQNLDSHKPNQVLEHTQSHQGKDKNILVEFLDDEKDIVTPIENKHVETHNPHENHHIKVASLSPIPPSSQELIENTIGKLEHSDFPDLKYFTKDMVRQKLQRVFQELPEHGFDPKYRSPCWEHPSELRHRFGTEVPLHDAKHGLTDIGDGKVLSCLPAVYLLGQPKCGTSDLFVRIIRHPHIMQPSRKEVRWFTRGEFATTPLPHHLMLTEETSIFSFTDHYNKVLNHIHANPNLGLTIDGGPHTLWWPTQSPDGGLLPDEIPPPQMIREIYGQNYPLKFLITLADPTRRLYSDYYFLDDSLKPVRPGHSTTKSSAQLHDRVVEQVNGFKSCVSGFESSGHSFFRASQMCAHDRHKFAVGGWGRLSIGLYVLFIEKWLEHFTPDQFMVLRMEEFDFDPRGYMSKVFEFLGLDVPAGEAGDSLMKSVLGGAIANEYKGHEREAMWPETESILRDFYRPYNELLAKLLVDEGFLWKKKTWSPEHPSSMEIHVHNPSNRHGPAAVEAGDELHGLNPLDATAQLQEKSGLRGSGGTELRPRSFSLEGLPMPETEEFNPYLKHVLGDETKRVPRKITEAADWLSCAAMGMDLAALKYFLYDVGIPADIVNAADGNRNAFHYIGLIFLMGDAHSRSHIFNLLKGRKSWISSYFNPPLEVAETSVLSRDIVERLDERIEKVAQWLLRAGTPLTVADAGGNTPLHYAAQGGSLPIVKILIQQRVPLNPQNIEGRTPLHLALAHGHAEIAGLLKNAGADLNIGDMYGANPIDMMINPGPILPEDAIKYLNTTQRPVRTINRLINPELYGASGVANDSTWPSTGGWGPERLPGFEADMRCDVDQFWAHEITGEEVFTKYMARMSPILIRGLIKDWPAIEKYARDNLSASHGDIVVEASSIPYMRKFGGVGGSTLTLREYIQKVVEHRIDGGKHPYYVFKGHPIPKDSDKEGSLVLHDYVPTPELIRDVFRRYPAKDSGAKKTGKTPKASEDYDRFPRNMFVNAQWAIGGEGTGAPVHFHNTAWAALIYGAKKWLIYPPRYMIMSNRQIYDYYETEMNDFSKRGVRPHTCVQTAGDVMIIPESWGHGVLNIQESVGVASEAKNALFRIRPFPRPVSMMPDDNRAKAGDAQHNTVAHDIVRPVHENDKNNLSGQEENHPMHVSQPSDTTNQVNQPQAEKEHAGQREDHIEVHNNPNDPSNPDLFAAVRAHELEKDRIRQLNRQNRDEASINSENSP